MRLSTFAGRAYFACFRSHGPGHQNAKAAGDRILDAAHRLLYGQGIRAVSVDAIIEKADVTKRKLYYQFKSKDELIAAYVTWRLLATRLPRRRRDHASAETTQAQRPRKRETTPAQGLLS